MPRCREPRPQGSGRPTARDTNAGGSEPFLQSLARGQYDIFSATNTRTDFAAWGGSVTFNTTTNWNFELATGPAFEQYDCYSVALHELAHALGFGTAPSWNNLVSGGNFTGATSAALNGGPVPATTGHWADGVSFGGQEAAMTPSIFNGSRKLFTELDFAGLDDLGWQVTPVPEPGFALLAAACAAGLWRVRRRPA